MKKRKGLVLLSLLLIPVVAFAAIDTAKERMSASMAAPLSLPDTSINAADRAQLVFVYRGIGTWGTSDTTYPHGTIFGNDLGHVTK